MRLLLDSCLNGALVAELIALGHDVVWAGDWPQDPGDLKVLAAAIEQQRVLVTLDKDFGEIAVRGQVRHAGIIRLANVGLSQRGWAVQAVTQLHETELAQGAICTVQRHRIRIRMPGAAGL